MHRLGAEVNLSVTCAHVSEVKIREVRRPGKECPDCVATGGEWVHLRECLICARVGCCLESLNRHATAHFHRTKHPVMTSLELGETWAWCLVEAGRGGLRWAGATRAPPSGALSSHRRVSGGLPRRRSRPMRSCPRASQ
jgi:Zn-finger in ubiquitin-hydrolases and other protein